MSGEAPLSTASSRTRSYAFSSVPIVGAGDVAQRRERRGGQSARARAELTGSLLTEGFGVHFDFDGRVVVQELPQRVSVLGRGPLASNGHKRFFDVSPDLVSEFI